MNLPPIVPPGALVNVSPSAPPVNVAGPLMVP